MKRYLKYIIIVVTVAILWLGFKTFKSEIIDLKEQYLIERNYSRNIEVFKNSIHDFRSFRNISIDFAEGNYMDAFTSGFHYLNIDSIIRINSYWSIDYEGYGKSVLFPEILSSLKLNSALLEKLVVCSYSYCLFKNEEVTTGFF